MSLSALMLARWRPARRAAVFVAAALLAGWAPQVSAQAERQVEFVTEGTYGLRLTNSTNGRTSFGGPPWGNITASLGFLTPVTPRVGVGIIGTAGLDSEFFFGIGPRLKWDATPTVSVDVTPQYLLSRSGPGPSPVTVELAVMHKDRIGGSLRFGGYRHHVAGPNFPEEFEYQEFDRIAVFAGVRLGSKPGRFAILADAIALLGVYGAYLYACNTGSGCS